MTVTHRIPLPALLLAFVTMAGCDAVDRTRARLATPDTAAVATASGAGLALGLQAPGALEAGDEGILRLSLTNRTDTIVSRVRLELIVPGWADPLPPRLGDREVTMAALEDGGTRFSYRLDDTPLEPGQAETIEQRIRVPTYGVVGDATVPWSRAVRARLLDLDGQLLAEVESEISLEGVATNGTPSAAGPVTGPVRDRLGPVRLGMTGPALRQAAPAARDTTWSQEGMEERGLVVPTGGGNALAVLSGDTVVRIDVVDPGRPYGGATRRRVADAGAAGGVRGSLRGGRRRSRRRLVPGRSGCQFRAGHARPAGFRGATVESRPDPGNRQRNPLVAPSRSRRVSAIV
jgi:hypothetical protein